MNGYSRTQRSILTTWYLNRADAEALFSFADWLKYRGTHQAGPHGIVYMMDMSGEWIGISKFGCVSSSPFS